MKKPKVPPGIKQQIEKTSSEYYNNLTLETFTNYLLEIGKPKDQDVLYIEILRKIKPGYLYTFNSYPTVSCGYKGAKDVVKQHRLKIGSANLLYDEIFIQDFSTKKQYPLTNIKWEYKSNLEYYLEK